MIHRFHQILKSMIHVNVCTYRQSGETCQIRCNHRKNLLYKLRTSESGFHHKLNMGSDENKSPMLIFSYITIQYLDKIPEGGAEEGHEQAPQSTIDLKFMQTDHNTTKCTTCKIQDFFLFHIVLNFSTNIDVLKAWNLW